MCGGSQARSLCTCGRGLWMAGRAWSVAGMGIPHAWSTYLPAYPTLGKVEAALPSEYSFAVDFLVLVPADLSFPISKGGPVDEVSGFPARFPKERFPTHPTRKHEKAASPADRKGWVPPAPATLPSCPGSWEGGAGAVETLRCLCPATILPTQTRLLKPVTRPSFWGGFSLGTALLLLLQPPFSTFPLWKV